LPPAQPEHLGLVAQLHLEELVQPRLLQLQGLGEGELDPFEEQLAIGGVQHLVDPLFVGLMRRLRRQVGLIGGVPEVPPARLGVGIPMVRRSPRGLGAPTGDGGWLGLHLDGGFPHLGRRWSLPVPLPLVELLLLLTLLATHVVPVAETLPIARLEALVHTHSVLLLHAEVQQVAQQLDAEANVAHEGLDALHGHVHSALRLE